MLRLRPSRSWYGQPSGEVSLLLATRLSTPSRPSTTCPESNSKLVAYEVLWHSLTFPSSLYSGFNQQGQKQAVFSWVPEANQNGLQADLWELVTYLVNAGNLTSDMYLGLIQFGTETVHATQNVTFQMQKAQMDLSVIKEKPTTTKGSPPATASATSKGAAYQVAPTGFALPAAAMGIAAAVLL